MTERAWVMAEDGLEPTLRRCASSRSFSRMRLSRSSAARRARISSALPALDCDRSLSSNSFFCRSFLSNSIARSSSYKRYGKTN